MERMAPLPATRSRLRFAALATLALSLSSPALAGGAADPAPTPPAAAAAFIQPVEIDEPAEVADIEPERGFDWGAASRQASAAMAFQHIVRVAGQTKTRDELGGPFFKDYWRSIKGIRGWNDGDSFKTNYVAHPVMGATAGYIQVQNDPTGKYAEFGANREYWNSRLRALGFSALYSTAFEIGPVSEATIGNVGLNDGTNGAVDFVVTPIGGVAWMVAEDAMDRHILQRLENHGPRWINAIARCFLNPSRSLARVTAGSPPWRRDDRRLDGTPRY